MKKRNILILFVAVMSVMFGVRSQAQIYDGMTQPTKFRVWIPTTVSLQNSKSVSVAPFIGFRQDIGKRFSVTPVLQYNVNSETFIPQLWLNVNAAKNLYILSRSIYDTRADLYKHTLSATYKLPLGFMVDGTWENLFNGKKFCDGDRLQFVAGWAHKAIVFNVGYSCRSKSGFIANFRWKVTDYNWLQFKYDGGAKNIQISTALQFN